MADLQLALEVAGYRTTLESAVMAAEIAAAPPAIPPPRGVELVEAPAQVAARSVGWLYGDEELAAEMLTAFRDGEVPRDLPAKLARMMPADGQTRVRLNWAVFELHRVAERARREAQGR